MSKRPLHWPVDHRRHWFQVLKYLEYHYLLRNTPPPSRDPGTYPGHTWWPVRSTATSSAHSGVCRAKSWMLCKSTLILQFTQCVHPGCHQFVWISLLRETHTCHTQLRLSDNQILSIPTWEYDTSSEPPHTLNTYGIYWSPVSAQTVHPSITLWILWIPATKLKSSTLNPYQASSYAIVCTHMHLCFLANVWCNWIELLQMALTLYNNPIQSPNQVPKVITGIVNCTC